MNVKRFNFGRAINFRDMGGVFGSDGKLVAWNKLYRSDKFFGTTDAEWNIMKKNGIKVIIDLRSYEEVNVSADNCPEYFEYIHMPIVEENLSFNNISSPAMQAFAKSVPEGYRNIVISHGENIAKVINLIADNLEKGGVVFHCTSGKDRTGILASVIYRLLGVSVQDIVADYQTSYTYNKTMSDKFMNDFPQYQKYYDVVLSSAENMYELLKLYDELDIEKYLINKGALAEKITKLRKELLIDFV